MDDSTWLDEALKSTRLAHRFLLAFSVAVATFFLSKAGELPRWKDRLEILDTHRNNVLLEVEDVASSDASVEIISDVRPYQEFVCVRSGGRIRRLAAWTTTAPTVSEIQSLTEIEILVPVLHPEHEESVCPADILDVHVDCQAARARLVLPHGESRQVPLEAHTRYFDGSHLTSINGYPEYGSVRDSTIEDALAIVEYKINLALSGAGAGLPVVTVASLEMVGLVFIALMLQLIWFMNRLREMALSGHAAKILGFPWEVTMKRPAPRWTINLATVTLPLASLYVGMHFSVMATLPYTDKYRNPSALELIVATAAALGALALLLVQIRLQYTVKKSSSGVPKRSRRSVGSLLIRTDTFVGRKTEIAAISGNLQARPYLAVVGVSGIGTTSLACKYAEQWQDQYPDGLFFLDCQALTGELARVGETVLFLPLRSDMSIEDRARATLNTLANRECLLIYDGVAGPGALDGWLPPLGHQCRILVTSICTRWGVPFETLEIGPLSTGALAELWDRGGLPESLREEFKQRHGSLTEQICRQVDRLSELHRSLQDDPNGPWLGSVLVSLLVQDMQTAELEDLLSQTPDADKHIERCRRHGLLGVAQVDGLAKRLVRHHALVRVEHACVAAIVASQRPPSDWFETARLSSAVITELCARQLYDRARAWIVECHDGNASATFLDVLERAEAEAEAGAEAATTRELP